MAVNLKRAYERNMGKINNNPAQSPVTHGNGRTARIVTNTYVLLHIENMKEPIIFCPSKRMTLGRWHDATPRKPDIDLASYSARENGVSRIHAAIQMQDDNVTIKDMGSCNGTRVNGVRVQPGQSYVLSDGDEIRLGRLSIKVGIKIKAPTSQDTMNVDDTPSIPAMHRQMGAGMLRPITPLVARQGVSEHVLAAEDDDTLVMPESRPQRPVNHKLPDFAGRLNHDNENEDVSASNPRPATVPEGPTQAKSSVIRPLARQSAENPKSTVEVASQAPNNRGARLIRPLSASTTQTQASVPVATKQAKPQNRDAGRIRPLSELTIEMPATTNNPPNEAQKESGVMRSIAETVKTSIISAGTVGSGRDGLLQHLVE